MGLILVAPILIFEIRNYHKLRDILLASLLVIVTLFLTIHTNNFTLLYLAVFGILYNNRQHEKIIINDLITKLIVLAINLIYMLIAGYKITYGTNFGFVHSNHFGYIIFSIYVSINILKRNNNFFVDTCLFLLAEAILYLSGCRTAQLIIIIYTLLKYIPLTKMTKKIATILPIGIIIGSAIMTFVYIDRNPVAVNINSMLSGRLWYQQQYYDRYGINLIGNNIETYIGEPLDNMYFRFLINFGIIGATVIILRLYRLIDKTNDKKMLAFYIAYIIYGASEWMAAMPTASPIMVTSSSKNKGEKKK